MDSRGLRRVLGLALFLALVGLSGCSKKPLAGGAAEGATCSTCHGNASNAAPPRAVVAGKTTSDVEVGMHQIHLAATPARGPVACGDCHLVPATIDAPGHIGHYPATVTFGALASARGAKPAFRHEAATCSQVYCHGGSMPQGGGSVGMDWRWTAPELPSYAAAPLPPTDAFCQRCHGAPPPAPHPQNAQCEKCHELTVKADGPLDLEGGHHLDGVLDVKDGGCNLCHGGDANFAPPLDTAGRSETSLVSVGAHQSHVRDTEVRKALGCAECHVLPASIYAPTHVDGKVEVSFGELARAAQRSPSWDHAGGTCSQVYCHGASLSGGKATRPDWTRVDHSQDRCDSCHGNPPPSPHPQLAGCTTCHPLAARRGGGVDVAGGHHIDGKVDVSTACNGCHGNADNAAPPIDLGGNSDTSAPGVGAHQQHLRDGAIRRAVACAECHLVPQDYRDPGHLDHGLPATLAFGPLATGAGALAPSFDPGALRCASVYCHGATLPGGRVTAPVWTQVDGSQKACDSCHGNPPPPPHSPNGRCASCHPDTVRPDGTIDVAGGRHIDGAVDVPSACWGCHGTPGNPGDPAPPRSTLGAVDAADPGVGAHQSHLRASDWHADIPCTECHRVPTEVKDRGHIDHDLPATLTFGPLASAGNASPAFDGTSCSVYCHGAAVGLRGGTATRPIWTKVDGSQARCGTCHGVPPPNHYGDQCGQCHPDADNAKNIVDKARHLDGRIDVAASGSCDGCHAYPPRTGAHLAHYGDLSSPPLSASYGDTRDLEGYFPSATPAASRPYYMFSCGNCHPLDASKHLDGVTEVELHDPRAPAGTLKALNPSGASYAQASGTCSGVYCHSSGQRSNACSASAPCEGGRLCDLAQGLCVTGTGKACASASACATPFEYCLVAPQATSGTCAYAATPTPVYRASPPWQGGTATCASCHDNPPRYPTGGPGTDSANTHLQLADDDLEFGHFAGLPGPWHWNLPGNKHGDGSLTGDGAAAITCQACHYDTVDPKNSGPSGFYYLDTSGNYALRGGGIAAGSCPTCHTGQGGAPPAGAGKVVPLRHVNGKRDVAFDARASLPAYPGLPASPNAPAFPYWTTNGHPGASDPGPPAARFDGTTWSVNLAGATYDPATKTCSGVACHLAESPARWGDCGEYKDPNDLSRTICRVGNPTCNNCHQY